MLINMTLEEFLKETASNSPAPGGGSVSALAGALGAALSCMVGNLSIGKDTEKEEKIRIQGKVKICEDLVSSLKDAVDKDTEAFNKVMAAFKMPKETDEDKKARSLAIQEGMKEAAELPYETAVLCIDVMNMAIDMLKEGNKNAASDAAVSGFMGYAALNGAIYNVKINLNSIKDTEYVNVMKPKVEALVAEGEMLLSKIKLLSSEAIG